MLARAFREPPVDYRRDRRCGLRIALLNHLQFHFALQCSLKLRAEYIEGPPKKAREIYRAKWKSADRGSQENIEDSSGMLGGGLLLLC